MRALVCAGLLLVGSVTLGANYAGTFRGDRMTVTLESRAGTYTGVIEAGEKRFPLEATATGDRLVGTFESEGNRFEFTASLKGESLTLTTGDAHYTLRRSAAVRNPLAKPSAGVAGDRAPRSKGPAAAAPGILRFRRVGVQDQADMIGGEAFSFLAPPDWQVEGGIVWRPHPVMPAAVAMRVRNPKGLEQVEFFPTVGSSWGGYLGPGTMFPPGSNYLGNEVQPPVEDAIAYLKGRLLPRARGAGMRIVSEEPLPELAEAARQAEPSGPGVNMVFTAGRVRIEYEVDGKPAEEDLYCVLNSVQLPASNLITQVADKLVGLRAERGLLDDRARTLQTVVYSVRPNLNWYNKYVQVVQTLVQAQMNEIRAAGELSRYISRTSDEISDMIRRSYDERQASQDRISKSWSQYTRGVEEYNSPVDQHPVELPSGYQSAWVNGLGEYVVTDSAGFNPNVELDGTWQKLEPVK